MRRLNHRWARISGAIPAVRTAKSEPKSRFRSGKEVALLPLPPLRTGHESFPSSGSSHYKAPRERSRFSRRFNPCFMAMDSELFAKRTFLKIVLPVWIERIGVRSDFNVPPDFGFTGIHQLKPNGFPLRRSFSNVRRKHPFAPADGVEVSFRHPSDPLPECLRLAHRQTACQISLSTRSNASFATIC